MKPAAIVNHVSAPGFKPTSLRVELSIYLLALLLAYALGIVPHIVDYGWAWGRPLAGSGFGWALLGALVTVLLGVWAGLNAATQPRKPRMGLLLRLFAVPALSLAPVITFSALGGLARSEAQGLVDRLRTSTPLEELQSWALAAMEEASAVASAPMPPAVSRTLPPYPYRVRVEADHVRVWWYETGILVGSEQFTPNPGWRPFFLYRVRPGIYVVMVEH